MYETTRRESLAAAAVFAVVAYVLSGYFDQTAADITLRLRRDGAVVTTRVTSQQELRSTSGRGTSQERSVTCESILDGQFAQGPAVRVTLHESGNCMRREGSSIDVVVSRADTSVWQLRENFEARDARGHKPSERKTRVVTACVGGLVTGMLYFMIRIKKRA